MPKLNKDWEIILSDTISSPKYNNLSTNLLDEYSQYICYPNSCDLFKSFNLTPFQDIKVVILGQDPYHTANMATGLAFAVPTQMKPTPSIRNIFKELYLDMGITRTNTDLTDLAKQGVLLMNSILSVRQGIPGSHKNLGWEFLTDEIIKQISLQLKNIVFILWGEFANSKTHLIDTTKHLIIRSAHPSPLSAYRGFFGSKPFSRANEYLAAHLKKEIIW